MGMSGMDMSNPEAEKANAEMAKAQAMGEMAAKMPGAITMNAGLKKLKSRQMNMEGMDMSEEDMAEMMCVCENNSFKVAEIMGLCASCMAQNNGETAAVESQSNDIPSIDANMLTLHKILTVS
jgi:hypothetical protein